MDCDLTSNEIVCYHPGQASDGKISNATIDSIIHATKLMLTPLWGCTRAGQVTCLINNIRLECTVH